MDCKCSKTKEIDKTTSTIFGNGKKGLVSITERLVEQLGYLTKTIDSVKTDVKVLLHFQTQVETREKDRIYYEVQLATMKNQHLYNKRWRIGLVITTIISISGLLIKLFV